MLQKILVVMYEAVKITSEISEVASRVCSSLCISVSKQDDALRHVLSKLSLSACPFSACGITCSFCGRAAIKCGMQLERETEMRD